MPASADLALGAGHLPAVEVDVEVVTAEALAAAVLAGGVARQRSGEGDPVFPGSLVHMDQGGVAAVDQVLGGQQATTPSRVWMPGRTWLSCVVAAVVAASVITLGPSGAQVSAR